jgi:hypothetical protein
MIHYSIPNGAQYVTLHNSFSHPSLVIYFFAIPRTKLELRLQIGERLLIAKHLDQSLWFICQVHNCAAPFTSLSKLTVQKCYVGQTHFAEPNEHVLTLLHPVLMCKITCWTPLGMLLGYLLGRNSVVSTQTRTLVLELCLKKSACLKNFGFGTCKNMSRCFFIELGIASKCIAIDTQLFEMLCTLH